MIQRLFFILALFNTIVGLENFGKNNVQNANQNEIKEKLNMILSILEK